MSIVTLKHVTLVGLSEEKERVLRDLQGLGCLELLDLSGRESLPGAPLRSQTQEALAFLLSCPRRRRQEVSQVQKFDAVEVERKALELMRQIQDLEDERDALIQRLRDLQPWEDFEFPELHEVDGQRLWFYAVHEKDLAAVSETGRTWSLISRDHKFCYIVVVSREEPADMPVPRIRSGSRSRSQLNQRLEEVEVEIEDRQDERAGLTRWCRLFARHLGTLEDRDARTEASKQTLDKGPVFALSAWAPADRISEINAYAADHQLVAEVRDPLPEEEPPTLLENAPTAAAGEPLVTFYMTPAYRTWDPSSVVLFSFALFFAMILADAGYGMVCGLIVLFLRKRLAATPQTRSWRRLLYLLTGVSLTYGMMAGSYFGMTPRPDSFLGNFVVLDMNDTDTMMMISVVIGVGHVVLGNLMNARRFGWNARALPPLGWAFMVLGGFLAAWASLMEATLLQNGSIAMALLGVVFVVGFSGVGKKPLARIGSGLLALTSVTSAFGDVLSYLRLFALGLASASLAAAFNDMAGQVRGAVAGGGLLLALMVLLVGHLLNFVLSLASAVIHGMRLNVIEFFNWSLTEEGRLFRPFSRKDTT